MPSEDGRFARDSDQWESRGALDTHFLQPHLAEFSAGLAKAVAVPPTIAFHEVVETTSPGG